MLLSRLKRIFIIYEDNSKRRKASPLSNYSALNLKYMNVNPAFTRRSYRICNADAHLIKRFQIQHPVPFSTLAMCGSVHSPKAHNPLYKSKEWKMIKLPFEKKIKKKILFEILKRTKAQHCRSHSN